MTEIARITHADTWLALRVERPDLVAQITAAWLLSKKSEHTRKNYQRDLTTWLAWCERCGTSPFAARIMHVDAWIAHQRVKGVTGDGEPAAESSIARRVSAVSSWYNYILKNTADDPTPLIRYNPAKTDARPKLDPDFSPTVGLSRAEADRLLEQADQDGPASSALIRLLFLDGLRCGSAINARVGDLCYDAGHRALDIANKGGTSRRVAIPPAVGEPLDAMLAARGNPTDGPLFLTSTGRPLHEPHVFRLVRRLALKAGIKEAQRLSPHSLRHTAITELLNSGASLRDVQDFAGHKDPRTTRRYDRARNSLDRHGAYRLAERFAPKRAAEE
jgi:integrase/recombinase XerD